MEPPKSEAPKLPNMVMSGDHPSFTKSELNAKETKPDGKEKDKIKEEISLSYDRISPKSSRSARAASEHALRLVEARRLTRLPEGGPRPAGGEGAARGTGALVQAALGSFRWPPYLLAVWVVVVVVAHALHALVAALERALPTIRNFCQYFRSWTEDSWKCQSNLNHRVYPVALACTTGLLYTLYCGLYAVYAVAVWSIEPLCTDVEETQSGLHVAEVKVTNYVDGVNTNTSSCTNH